MDHKYLGFLDIVSYQPKMMIFGKDRYSSIIGIFIGTISLITMFVLSGFFILRVFNKSEATVILSQSRDFNTKINAGEFPLTFAFSDSSLRGDYPINQMFDLQILRNSYSTINGTIVLNSTRLRYSKCDKDRHFGNKWDMYKDLASLNASQCIDTDQDLTIHGKYGDFNRGFSLLLFSIGKCVNSTANANSCYPEASLLEKYKNLYFLTYVMDRDINHQDNSDPIKLQIRQELIGINTNLSFFKRVIMYLKNVVYTTDNGLMFEDNSSHNFYQVDGMSYDTDVPRINRAGSLTIAYFSIHAAERQDYYTRSYLKLQSVIASIGGVIKTIQTGAIIILYTLTRKMFLNDIANYISADPNLNNSLKLRQNFLISNPNSIVMNLNNSNVSLRTTSAKDPQRKSSLSLIELLCCKRCLRNRTKLEELDLIQQHCERTTSFEGILRIYEQMHYLKKVFLNEEEVTIFDNLNLNVSKIKEIYSKKENNLIDLINTIERRGENNETLKKLINLLLISYKE